jgi:hypothetical protein
MTRFYGATDNLVRRRFNSIAELISLLYASLVQFLEKKKMLRNEPFDLSTCEGTSLNPNNGLEAI